MTLNIDRLVPAQIQLLSNPANEQPSPLALRLAPELKAFAVLLGHANMRESKKVERLWLSKTSCCSAFSRKAAELDQTSLFRVQC
jgi:hypothetical protein